jgi:hypothetical protein
MKRRALMSPREVWLATLDGGALAPTLHNLLTRSAARP